MKAAALCLPLCLVLAGCAHTGRYQMTTNAAGNVLWRLDTWTGETDACGFESGKPVCTPFPGPRSTK